MTVYNLTADSTFFSADSTAFTADLNIHALPSPITRSVEDYSGLITPWQSTKARFVATVQASVAPFCDTQAVVASLPHAFDLDEAIGAQLDIVGQWVGRTRNVPTPVPNTLFSFDTVGLGFDQGYWSGPYDGTAGISQLPDDAYRRLLYAKVMANGWDGTATGTLSVLDAYFVDPTSLVFIDDRAIAIPYAPPSTLFSFDIPAIGFDQGQWAGPFDDLKVPDVAPMAYSVCISGKIPSKIDLYVLGNDLIPVKAMGVDVDYSVTTVDGTALFGFDMADSRVAGFDSGAWGADPLTVAALLS